MPAFERTELTKSIIRYLATLDKGTRVTYDELSGIISYPVDSRSPNLISARKILEREHNAVWNCIVPRIGVVRLTDPEIAARQGSWYLLGARNKLKAGAAQADVVELDELNLDQQARFATHSIIREIAREALSKATERRVEKTARGTSNDLPTFSAIEWMISLSARRGKNV